jgi:phosphoesterase RecJ-like protein
MQQTLQAFKAKLEEPQRVVITTHHKPDADALGSSLGLAAYLKKIGHRVTVITPSDYPSFLHWMVGNDDVVIFSEELYARASQEISQASLIFCLDFSSLARINELGEMVRESKAEKVLIDHHLEPEDFAAYSFHDTSAASTAELVYQLIVDLGDKSLIDPDMADALYAGIMTDTGSFKHPNTTVTVHRVVADLIGLGANVHKVSKLVYDSNSLDRLRFLGFCLSEKLTVLPEYRTAYIAVSAEELAKYHSKTGDTEGLVNYALSVKGVILAVMIAERPEGVKMSFRSIGDFSVNKLAREHFNGGGHKNAAGGISPVSLVETVDRFIGLLPQYESELQPEEITHS